MDIDEIRAFTEIAETGSVSAAAERLFITQPAASKRLSRLEDKLAVKLFDRVGRRMSLTEAGQLLVPQARALLGTVADIQHSISGLSGQTRGSLAIATSHHIGLHRLPDVLREFIHTYPDVDFDIQFVDSEQGCRAVEQNEIELAIVTLPVKPQRKLVQTRLWDDPLIFAVSQSHPLAKRERITLDELVSYPAVLPSHGTYTRAILDEVIHQHNAGSVTGMSINYLETINMLVSIGLGWSLLPRSMIHPDCVDISVNNLSLSRKLGIVTHRQRTLSNAAQALITVCKKHSN